MTEHSGETRQFTERDFELPIIRGESERLWHPCPPHVVWPFRCTHHHPQAGRCRRGRWHEGDHWARDIWWEAIR